VDHSERMDPVGVRLLQRIQGLLATRPDLKDRAVFGRRIGRPTPSWLSEFLNGKRTTNDLRLVIKIAKVFGVNVGYLLGDGNNHDLDEGAATILATYTMVNERDRGLLLSFAASLRPATDEESGRGDGGASGGGGNTTASNAAPRKLKRRKE
jgi:transcriptional regulator with XRE-family HTH domain